MGFRRFGIAAALLGLLAQPAVAQSLTGPAPSPNGLLGTMPPPPAAAPTIPLPGGAIGVAPPPPAVPGPAPAADAANLSLAAVFSADGRPIRSGLVWRVFAESGVEARPKLIAKSTAAAPTISLSPGSYTVHVAYGFATASRRISVSNGGASERLAVNGGALKLAGAIGDSPISPDRLSFSVFLPVGNDSEGRLVVGNVRAGEIIRLPEGSYHVVSTYGESNAIMRVDLKVEAGRLTEATVNHRAATVTLKLVAAPGGEAFAGTAFSVLTPGGDVIREAIGAFPTVTLAEGEYMVIARHDGRVYTREFKVESGLDRDIEVLAGNS
ncbi:hypothetical protein [Enterovirga aerilata]|nr:hypothetical protein [Enterovirga sp. DB1703]